MVRVKFIFRFIDISIKLKLYNVFGLVCGQSVNEDDIPFKMKEKFTTSYCNLTGEENATYLFYTYINVRENIDDSIKRLVQINNEMKKLKNERDEIIESLGTNYVIVIR